MKDGPGSIFQGTFGVVVTPLGQVCKQSKLCEMAPFKDTVPEYVHHAA